MQTETSLEENPCGLLHDNLTKCKACHVILGLGCIRHPEHKTLNLGDTWHLVIKNNVKRSLSLIRQGGGD